MVVARQPVLMNEPEHKRSSISLLMSSAFAWTMFLCKLAKVLLRSARIVIPSMSFRLAMTSRLVGGS